MFSEKCAHLTKDYGFGDHISTLGANIKNISERGHESGTKRRGQTPSWPCQRTILTLSHREIHGELWTAMLAHWFGAPV